MVSIINYSILSILILVFPLLVFTLFTFFLRFYHFDTIALSDSIAIDFNMLLTVFHHFVYDSFKFGVTVFTSF